MASPPSAGATLHPGFGAAGEARQAAIAARSTFFDERIRDGFSGLLWPTGAVSTRCCRHAATAHTERCQAEIAGDSPLPLEHGTSGSRTRIIMVGAWRSFRPSPLVTSP